jgi:hypothetical protein
VRFVDHHTIGRTDKVPLTVRFPGGETYTDIVDVADTKDKERYLRGLCNGR